MAWLQSRIRTLVALLLTTALTSAGACSSGATGDGGASLDGSAGGSDTARDAAMEIRLSQDVPPPRETRGDDIKDPVGAPDGDAGPRDAGADAGFPFEPCVDNSDCPSGFCVPTAHGSACTTTCVDTCPAGWVCRPVGLSPDILYLCVDPNLVLCRPCLDSGDCAEARAGLDGFCAPAGPDGAFCGTACRGDDCPPGYACAPTLTTEGETRSICVRSEGVCDCTPFSVQNAATTACYVENEHGRCDGARRCTAAGLTACDAAVPAPETCDHRDNDCDGATDEEVSLPDAIGDPCEDDDDNDGVPDTEDCAPFDPATGSCDDGNPCTEDRCNPAFGVCSHPPVAGDCDDGDACTTGDHCEGGACVFSALVEVDDGDPCTQDGCTPTSGPWHAPLDGPVCDDGNPCTTGERCYGGLCGGGAALDCDDQNPCTDDTCRTNVPGGCVYTPNRAECEDGDACTLGDRCADRVCVPGAAKDCDDDNPCTADRCDSETGACVEEALADGTDCDEGDRCDGVWECGDGVCVEAVAPVRCPEPTAPCLAVRCVGETGACVEEPADEGLVCDDGDPCNGVSHCAEGACLQDVEPVVCAQDEDPCTESYCNALGACAERSVDGCCHADADCEDGDPCTDDVCVADRCDHFPNGIACRPVVIEVELPEGAPPLSAGAFVLSPWGRHPVGPDGRATVSALVDTAVPVVLVDGGLQRLAALLPPAQSTVTMDAPATARALLYLYANGAALPPQYADAYATFVAELDADGALAAAVAAAVVAGESPFDARDAGRLGALQAALEAALQALVDWTTPRPLGNEVWVPADEGAPAADPRAADGFGVLAARVGPDGVRLSVESRTPRPAALRVRRVVAAGQEVVADGALDAAACCTFTTPFAAAFGAATGQSTTDLGPFVLDSGAQTFVVDVLTPGLPDGPLGASDSATFVDLNEVWVGDVAVQPAAAWLESLRVTDAGAGCWTTVARDWLAGRAAAWTPTSLEVLDLADVTAALFVDVAHQRGVFGPCVVPAPLTAWLDALHGVAGLARRSPTVPPAASFGWLSGERLRPARLSFAVADCLPDCSGAECGDDLCGGSCGGCEGVLNCVERQCRCEGTCGALECGPSPCGEDCGTCAPGRHCVEGVCECDPPSALGCANDALYWLDGCGNPVGDPVESCLLGCATGRTACNECDPFSACCQADGSYVPPDVQAPGCTGTCRACDGAGSCGPPTDGTACSGGVCVGGLCKSCLPGTPCCDAVGNFVGAGQNGAACQGPCEQCNGAGACLPRPDRIDCPDGICWQGVCEQCEPGTLCCDENGDFLARGVQGPECTGICRACDGAGRCGPAPDGASCPNDGICNVGSCRECLANDTCCTADGWFVAYGRSGPACDGACVQCDGSGSCIHKAHHLYCTADNQNWCENGQCVPVCDDECSPGQTRCNGSAVQTCGNFDGDACLEFGGDQTCTCGCSGGACLSGACSPGQTSSVQCGNCGTQARICNASCQWENSGTCTGQGVCSPGATESSGCGNCGTWTRTCTSSCQWGSYGTCNNQGVCSPGSTQSQGCGNCGSQSRTCTSSCSWGTWGTCNGQGVCSPGATQQGSCDPCSRQTCQSNCQWGGCGLLPGKTCEWRSGTNWRCCGYMRWQFCLPPSYGDAGCKWSPDCVYTSTACW